MEGKKGRTVDNSEKEKLAGKKKRTNGRTLANHWRLLRRKWRGISCQVVRGLLTDSVRRMCSFRASLFAMPFVNTRTKVRTVLMFCEVCTNRGEGWLFLTNLLFVNELTEVTVNTFYRHCGMRLWWLPLEDSEPVCTFAREFNSVSTLKITPYQLFPL